MINKTLKNIMTDKGAKIKDIAQPAGFSSPQVLSVKLYRNDFTAAQLTELCAVLDCDLLIRDKSSGKEYRLDNDNPRKAKPRQRKQTEPTQPDKDIDDILGPDFWEL